MKKLVSIVIACYNEENRLPESLKKISAYIKNRDNYDFEVILVDDGSKDGTQKVIKESEFGAKIIVHDVNRGKGAGLRTGVKEAKGDLVYLADADLSSPIEELDKFIEEIEKGYDCVIGSRALALSKVKTSFVKKLLGRVGNGLINALLRLNIKDTQCGFKLLNRRSSDVFLKTTIDRWGFDFEWLLLMKDNGLTISEMPVRWTNTEDSRVTAIGYFITLRDLVKVWFKHYFVKRKSLRN